MMVHEMDEAWSGGARKHPLPASTHVATPRQRMAIGIGLCQPMRILHEFRAQGHQRLA